MQELEVVIHNPTGLHARPAKVFVNIAKQFSSAIKVHHGEKKANGKSLISMLTLGAEKGAEIRITVDGDDEGEAIRTLEEAIRSGLGEGPAPEATTSAAAAGNGQTQPTTASEPTKADAPPATDAGKRQLSAGDVVSAIAAAPGIAIGPVFHLRQQQIELDGSGNGSATVTPGAEQDRLQEAIEASREELAHLREKMAAKAPEEAAIFDVHVELLDDPDLAEAVAGKIEAGASAPHAWQSVVEQRAQQVAALGDPLLAERAADLRDVGRRVLRQLTGAKEQQLPGTPAVVIASDLTPSDTAALGDVSGPGGVVLGFCTAAGGPTGHAAIIARALRLPAVVGAGHNVLDIADGTTVILDGVRGTLTIAPDEQTLAEAKSRQKTWQEQQEAASAGATEPAVTLDGHRVEIVANVGGAQDAREGAQSGAEGIGLLRTEFLFLSREQPPSEEEQAGVYADIMAPMAGQPVIVRTLDIGGDKPLPYVKVAHEDNPFLGERGIRLCLNRPELLRPQVRAILRAAARSEAAVSIMFPMVCDVGEFRQAQQIVNEERDALSQNGLSLPDVDLGIMVEVPATALMADCFAAEVDFFSIGTNDLTQYTLAIDRMHPTLAGKSDGLHPAILRLIHKTVEAAHEHGKWVGVCGELGADPQAVPLLVGLGVDELSVSVPAIAAVKAQIRSLNLQQCQALAQKALACTTAQEVRALVADASTT
jgi:phosphocarrier protein FPr